MKHLMLKVAPSGNIDCEAFDRGLLELRNTPNHTGRSPAQILYGRPLRSCIPTHAKAVTDEWQARAESCDRRAAARVQDARTRYDERAQPLCSLVFAAEFTYPGPLHKKVGQVGYSYGYRQVTGLPDPVTKWPSLVEKSPRFLPAADIPSLTSPRRSERLKARGTAQDL